MVVIVFLVVFPERVFLGCFFGKYGSGMEFLQSLIARITTHECIFVYMSIALLKQTEVVRPADAKAGGDDFVFFIGNELCLQCVTLLFARIVLFLLVFSPLFCGRSMGLSATSMTRYLSSTFFSSRVCFPLRWSRVSLINASSTIFTVRKHWLSERS